MNRALALSRFVLDPAQWSPAAEACARKIPFDSPGDFVEWLAAEVRAGRSELFRILHAEQEIGYLVVAGDGSELIVQAVCGHDHAAPLSPDFLAAIDLLAASRSFASIRLHTMRRAIINLATADGYRMSEIILRKEVTP